MYKDFNSSSGIIYSNSFNRVGFGNVQFQSFYSSDCSSIVFCVEDQHHFNNNSTFVTDLDFNDVIFSISDNKDGGPVTKVVLPVWSVGQKIGESAPSIKLTENR
jgi:hypothetical protein